MDDDTAALPALIDTSAFASVTDQLIVMRVSTAFGPEHCSPTRLLPATKLAAIVPVGYRSLHVSAL